MSAITSIVERNRNQLWVGTLNGLYLFDKESGTCQYIELPIESGHICSLYQTGNTLYIGTGGAGLLIYQINKQLFIRYHKNNCALTSNHIYTILPHPNGYLILGTGNGIAKFIPQKQLFYNWTKEQGLMTSNFNACSGTRLHNNHFILGSNDGAIEFPPDIQVSNPHSSSSMIFSDFMISYQTFYPGDEHSPLKTDLNQTKKLKLKYSQNTFSLKVSSINYDYPSNILYSWKLEGFYNEWSQPSPDGRIRYTNLAPGKYTLHIRSLSNEEKYKIYGERSIRIIIEPPVWASVWAMIVYAILSILIIAILFRLVSLKRKKKISEEKVRFFINTAHNIRTPLTLIKTPLEEMIEKKQVNTNGMANIFLALKNVEILLQQATKLVNFEKAGTYSSKLQVAEHELGAYMTELYHSFLEYACSQHINFTIDIKFSYLNVWFDKDKIDSILDNIISNAIKYTPEGGSINLTVYDNKESWSVRVKDTGIGIPAHEQKELFKSYFRGSNAIKQNIGGNGIGLLLVHKLVCIHQGKITINSIEQKGTIIKVSFPKENKHFKKTNITSPTAESTFVNGNKKNSFLTKIIKSATPKQDNNQLPHVLIVEDNNDLRNYLENTLSEEYKIKTCSNGKKALEVVEQFNPALIVSDIMMPEMNGDELCMTIKNNIETSHIPVILLTALGDETSMINGLKAGADDYIAKPFSIGILKASISSLLTNRALLHKKYGTLELDDEVKTDNGSINKDWEFIASVKKNIENNLINANFNVDSLCSMHNMSRTSFFNKVKALTGYSPSELIRLIRLKHARNLLRQGYSSEESADMSGFCDGKYFGKIFKKYYKECPSQYSKRAKEKKAETNSNVKPETRPDVKS